MKFKELKAMNPEELQKKLVELKREIMKENTQIATGTVPKSPGKLRVMKKTIARINGLLGAKTTA
jgi:large subunit ribosomal protein L29